MRKLFITFILSFSIISLNAQIRGTVKDKTGAAVAGAYIYDTSDSRNFTMSDKDGAFYLDVEAGTVIDINLSDRLHQTFLVKSEEQEFVFSDRAVAIEDSFRRSNFETTTSSVSTITAAEIANHNGENIYSSLYGTVAGLTSLFNSDYDGDPTFYVRGKKPLIIVDGFERSLKEISASEIESVTLLKDGAAAALYGMEGSDGVLVITTKRGDFKSMKAEVDYKFGMGTPYTTPSFVDAATYAAATNEALLNDGLTARYTPAEITAFQNGDYPFLYPNVNWLEEGLRDFTTNHELGITFKGGGENVRYYTHVDYVHDMGLLNYAGKTADNYSPQMRRNKLSARVNMDVNLTKSTVLKLNLLASMKENHRPAGDDTIIEKLYKLPSNAFPVKSAEGMWGSSLFFNYNPIADIQAVGYHNNYQRALFADFRLTQDLSMWVRGLKVELAASWDNMAGYTEGNQRIYQYQENQVVMDPVTGIPTSTPKIYNTAEDYKYKSNLATQRMASAFEAKISYARSFGLHNVDANLLYRQQAKVLNGRNATTKYQNIALYGAYSYANRYIVDIVANYHGSSLLLDGQRFEFYPSVSAAWVLSNENWLKDSAMHFLKIRASYGRGGKTANDYDLDKNFIIPGPGYFFGNGASNSAGGRHETLIPVDMIKAQISDKINVGIDMSLLSRWDLSVDFFKDYTSRIFQDTKGLYSEVLGIQPPQQNHGKHEFTGVDLSTSVHKDLGDFKYRIGGTFSFVRSKVTANSEGNVAEPYLSKIGQRVGQIYGLRVDPNHMFFQDEQDIANSPEQTFSAVRPGDVKYVDKNGDGRIDNNDREAMGFSDVPEIYYGINLNFEWKGLGLNLNFQGTGNYSAMLPNNTIYNPIGVKLNNLSTWYAEDNVRWTPETAATATLPRLSSKDNANNRQKSSLWLVDASYFGLRDAYLYYNLPQKWVKKMHMSGFQIYFKGQNIFMVDSLKYSNPDSIEALYPAMRNFFVGLNIKF